MRATRVTLFLCAVLGFALIVSSSVLDVPTGTWHATGDMNSARADAAAVLVPDGRIVFAGGTDAGGQPTVAAEAMSSDGAFSALPDMNAARSGHAAALTLAGDLLVTGGRTSGGGFLNTAEVFDSLSNSWHSQTASMAEARAGHTMSPMPTGDILIAGGENSNGPVAALETYDIATGQFTFVGTLNTARTQHAAAVLNDGRVLIIGGRDVNGATLASTEIYDPSTGAVSAGPSLATPRAGATATTLLDGRVLVVGGSYPEGAQNGVAELASAEVFDPAAGSFSASASQLSTPRAGHLAFLLPNNNNVLIVGGSSAGSDLASAELYASWNDAFQQTGSMAAARSAAAGSAMGSIVYGGTDGRLVVSGGNGLNSGDMYGFATVKTDHDDYAPGSVVTITGSGWRPGETVTLSLQEVPHIDDHPTLTAVADANGNIFNDQFSPDQYDLQVRFYLTAVGSQSGTQAQNTFTDAVRLYKATITPSTDTSGHTAAPYILKITNDAASTDPLNSVTIAVPTGYSAVALGAITQPPGNNWTASLASNVITLSPTGNPKLNPGESVSLALTATAPCTAGAYQWTTTPNPGNFTLNPPVSQPTVNVTGSCSIGTTTVVTSSLNPSTYGQSVSFTANVSPVSGNIAPTGTVQFKVDGNNFGAPVTLTANGSIGTATSGSTATLTAAPHVITAVYSPTGVFTASNGNLTQTVNPRTASVTPNAASKIYGDADPVLTGTLSGFLPADNVTATYNRTPGETVAGSPYTISATLSPQGVLSNYTITYNTANFTINAKAASVTPNGASKTYGDPDPTLTGTLGGFLAADNVTATYTRTAGETVAGSPYTISATLSPQGALSNYSITYNTANFTIDRRNATWTTNAGTKTYGDQDPNPLTTGSGSNFVAADNVTATYSRAPGETVLGGPYHITATLSPAGVLSNYNITNAGADFTITPRNATWTTNPNSKTYGDVDPNPLTTGSGSNFVAADNVTATYSRVAGETVAGGPYHISATLAPTNLLSNYNITNAGANFTINKRDASVTPNAASKTYGDADPALTGTLTNFVAGDGVTATYSRTAGETVAGSPYTISATLSPQGVLGNYNVTYNTANFSITPRPASVTPSAASKVYGDADPPLTGTLTGFLAADNITATYNRTAGETVAGSPYTISASLSPTGVLGNYSITYNTANFAITKRPASVTPNTATKVYGDPDPALTGTLSGFVAADNVTATYTRTAGETVAGSPYTISATLSPSGVLANYDVTYHTAAFSITAKAASVTPNTASKTYGQPDPPLTGVLSGFLPSDAVTATYSRTAGETVAGSPYLISATLNPAGVLSNYSITYNTANFAINPAALSIRANDASKILGTTLTFTGHEFTTNGLVNGDTVTSVTLTSAGAPANAGIGQYPIVPSAAVGTGLANYNISYVNGTLKVIYVTGGVCLGDLGHSILQPINVDGNSVFKQGSTVPAKFRVCDANGNSIGLPGVVASFSLDAVNGGTGGLNEDVDSTTPDTQFRWSPSDMQWIFNMNTKGLQRGFRYTFKIVLNDNSTIYFSYGLK